MTTTTKIDFKRKFLDPLTEIPKVIERKFDNQDVTLVLQERSFIRNNCIVIDPVFFHDNKANRNTASAFHLPSINLRYYCTALTYGDFVKNKEDLQEVIDFLKEEVLKHNGCLITNHGPYWQKLAIELLERDSHVYTNDGLKGTNIYKCSLGHD